jgi:hypothetical protein
MKHLLGFTIVAVSIFILLSGCIHQPGANPAIHINPPAIHQPDESSPEYTPTYSDAGVFSKIAFDNSSYSHRKEPCFTSNLTLYSNYTISYPEGSKNFTGDDSTDEVLSYLLSSEFSPEQVQFDYYILLHWINKYVDSSVIEERINLGLQWANENLETQRLDHHYLRLLDPTYQPDPDNFHPDPLLASIYCDLVAVPPEHPQALLDYFLSSGGEGTTHALFALLDLRDRGCFSPDTLEPFISSTISRLVNETEGSISSGHPSNDTLAQSVFFLIRAGYPEKVEQEWINFLKGDLERKQSDLLSHSIYSKNCSRCKFNFYHETLLEILALLKWEEAGNGAQ